MKKIIILLISIFFAIGINAQLRPDMKIYVNEEVSTHIATGEPIKYVDISTDKVAGDIPVDNILRIKPIMADSSKKFKQGDILAIVTVVTERNKIQLECVYMIEKENAWTNIDIADREMASYVNPEVRMSQSEMYRYSWNIFNLGKKYYDVSKEQYKLRITLNNIYTVGDYFFVDVSLMNKTNIKYDIDQVRFKIEDKKQTKATNFQQIEIQPVMSLIHDKSFQKDYRNIFVFDKFTFPDEKVFTVEVAEKQISGRTVILKIDYADVLNADSFNKKFY